MKAVFRGLLAGVYAAYLAACGGGGGSGGDADGGIGAVNECELGTHDCDENATCTDTAESFTCECNDGYDGDGQSCTDIDECAAGTAECSGVATCTNTPGTYECACPDSMIRYGGECVALSAGYGHACLIRDGALYCWGDNEDGQLGLGLGDLQFRTSPTRVGDKSDWVAVDAGKTATCAIRQAGTLYCWGEGVGFSDFPVPSSVGTDEDWAQVQLGSDHQCGLKSDGKLFCWGSDSLGQLGNGPDQTAPVPLPEQIGTDVWKRLAVTQGATCAVATDGSLSCWGSDGEGQLGNGSETGITHEPAAVAGVEDVAHLSGGIDGSFCAAATDGDLYCWGLNQDGQLGTGGVGIVASPDLVASGFAQAAVGRTGCAIDQAGGLHCSGRNEYGQLGVGDRTNDVVIPTAVEDGHTWVAISAGNEFLCGLADTGDGRATLHCWGKNRWGAIGLGEGWRYPEPVQVAGTWKAVSAGGRSTCALRSDDTLWCWGENQGALGIDSPHALEHQPMAVAPAKTWQGVDTGLSHGCAIDNLGALYCWGENDYGSVGVGDQDPHPEPVQVGTDADWKQVSTGDSNTCAVRGTPGSLYCWGNNYSDQSLGGGASWVTAPANVGDISQDGDENWIAVSAGQAHVCGHLEEPTPTGSQFALYCWGNNGDGQIGNGTTGGVEEAAVRIDVDQEWVLGSGHTHSCGLNDSNELLCWGDNQFGQLGLGDTDDRDVPTENLDIANWTAISGGVRHSCGLAPVVGGTGLFCTGANSVGQLGTGDGTDQLSFVRVGAATDWTQLSAGWYHTCAINAANQLYCWGSDELGQIGRVAAYRDVPTAIDE